MIVVKVELHSAVTGDVTELARMHMSNTGEGTATRSDYLGETFIGRTTAALNRHTVSKRGDVRGHRRLDLHVWNLVAKMLNSMGYTQ